MEKNKTPVSEFVGSDLVERLWEKSCVESKTVVDVAREPVLILDKELRVVAANESFYRTFQMEAKDTEKHSLFELRNGQWNIPPLTKLLEDVLPKNTFFKGFEMAHDLPFIGKKILLLSARQIFFTKETSSTFVPPAILLAMEDVTEMMLLAEKLAGHTNHIETQLAERTEKLESQIKNIQKELNGLKN